MNQRNVLIRGGMVGAEYESCGKVYTASGFDHIVLAMRSKSYNPLEERLTSHID